MENQQTSQLQEQKQTIFIEVIKSKNVGLAFALAILFGPPGLLYSSIAGGIIMSIFAFLSFLVLPAIGLFSVWVGCIIWAVTAAQNANQGAVAKIIIRREAGRLNNRG